jgi:hypothetical protein
VNALGRRASGRGPIAADAAKSTTMSQMARSTDAIVGIEMAPPDNDPGRLVVFTGN